MNKHFFKFFLKSILFFYLVGLCWVLFFQVGDTNRDTYFQNPDDHLLPFHSTYDMLKKAFTYRYTSHGGEFRNIFLVNVFGNLVLLLPWGILAPLVFEKLNSFKAIAISGFFISLSAEVIQFSFSLGVFDIDDLMFNTVGAIVGYYILHVTKYFLWSLKIGSLNRFKNKNLNQNQA